jgi:hypothetical protein
MSDFDFEELDKAVNGALQSDSDALKDAPVKANEPTPSTEVATPVTPEVSKTAPATRRSAGRFMDVVHPSSDMRGASSPSNTSVAAPTAFTPPTTPSEPITPEVSTRNESSSSDPLEDSLDTPVGAWTKPLESPFLADAKVEKRPLGGLAPEFTQELLDAPEEELKLEAPDEPLLEASYPDPIDFATQSTTVPEEVTATDTVTLQTPELESISEPVIEEAVVQEVETSVVEQEPTSKSTETQEAEAPAGPASITQQYTEQPSANQQSGSIYDTENYHQPLAHNAKKRSGAWVILWIFLLVILGAGAGVAFYFYVLPML